MARLPNLHTLEELERHEAGWTGEEDRLLNLEEETYQQTPMGARRATALSLTRKILGHPGSNVRVQLPLYRDLAADLRPDLAVLPRSAGDYAMAHPRNALLVVEISDSFLADDLRRRQKTYARHGIPEYWVVDLDGRRLLRYTQPHELGYAQQEQLGPEASLSWGGRTLRVADLLP